MWSPLTITFQQTPGGGGDSNMEQTGMPVRNFEFNPKGDQSGRALSKF